MRRNTSSTSSLLKKPDQKDATDDEGTAEKARAQRIEKIFNQPTPSPWKRAALIAFTVALFWLAFSMRMSLYQAKKQPQVIHAQRSVCYR
jgi:hypothetical protein